MKRRRVLVSCGPEMLSPEYIRELGKLFGLAQYECAMGENHIVNAIKDYGMSGYILGGLEHFSRKAAEIVSGTLEWIAFLGDQENTFIDVKACEDFGIQVFKTGGGARSVAQKTYEQIVDADRIRNRYAKQFKWVSGNNTEVRGLVRDQKISIIGAGQIGQMVMRKLKRLMRHGKGEVIYAGGRGEKPELSREGFRYEKYLEEAFDADVVSLHLSYVPGSTEDIVTPAIFSRIRRNGLFINNARAELTNPFGLLRLLEHRQDVTCIFDAFWKEGAEFEKSSHHDILWQLIDLPNFFFTQHSAALHVPKWTQEEYWLGLQRIIAENNLA